MSLLISVFLVISTVLLNFLLLISKKLRDYRLVIDLNDLHKSKYFILLNKLWKKEIAIVSLGITLCFLSIFIESSNKTVLNTFFILSSLYSFIGIGLGIYNHNSFNKEIYYLLNKYDK